MKKYCILLLSAFICLALSACDSNNSKTLTTENTEISAEKSTDTTNSKEEKKTLNTVGDSVEDPNVGTVTLESSKDLNQVLKVGDLSVYLTGVKVLTVSNMADQYHSDLQNSLKEDLSTFTYAQIKYSLKNNSDDQLDWSGFEYAVVNGVQKDLGYNRMMRFPNPENIEILGNSSQENSFVTVPVTTSTKKVRLKTADVLLADRSKENRLTRGKEIEISLK
ncbi:MULTISPECIES: hypothetical protein [Bacillus]|uniref:hypothetical protein n=1 Tax=Bacillus TaxID=1386 RepID=UPI0002AA812C|nr:MULTISPECIES: hypothetical protein [Bacillus]APA01930.1 hypothetical protein BK055_05040 [Bacillus velezensis]ARW38118.1 hypothetical protein S101267_01028 [Bacillus amyloliquefaciens]AZI46215.1 hypothetical protein BVMH_04760 [Bacillus velezensis]KYC92561.1 hypothetical protein B425_0889 [Bacillus amyloliquefaciens]MBY0032119.1 hypothetical protein [Bacillus velezensis]